MRQFDTALDSLETIHAALTARDHAKNAQIEATVRAILDDVKARRDAAVLDYTRRFDWPEAETKALEVSIDDMEVLSNQLTTQEEHFLNDAAYNIRDFHEREKGQLQSWMHILNKVNATEPGRAAFLGQTIQPIRRAGIYIPGGKAAYPSTVLMAGIPATVAGCQIVFCTPPDADGQLNPLLVAACYDLPGRLFKIGGAQAIAAMAYGTETVPKCDIIVGPGNAYVNTAKKLVYGEVGIDMLAGPSEVAIIADEYANPAFVAADLLAQTEHGHDNRGVVFCHSAETLENCKNELAKQREALSRKEILAVTANNLIFVKTNSLEESLELSNVFAPEHLELMVREPLAALPLVRNAGAVLMGEHTSASIGDYWAGPSHTLPTAGAARYASPLSVNTFMKRTSVIYYSQKAAEEAAEDVARFAEAEGFDGHAAAARLRGPHPQPLPHQNGRREHELGEKLEVTEEANVSTIQTPLPLAGEGSTRSVGGGGQS
ncbi:MAG: histidinol dehydrogenase [Janthinobacterium lividum]